MKEDWPFKYASWVFIAGLGIFIGLIVTWALVTHKPHDGVPPAPCTSKACIELNAGGRTIALLNDFRFAPGHCINYLPLNTSKWQQFCGDYQLQWIGPK